mmetsp:Transcript_10662/g.25667  ORF Transcript_10662/g.25667 Transcript_10662/m.25667 type:complete len:276 (-) Transcript_10662:187-1014(-)|eukprot:CAMPEP_0197187648 /NCGR_PEP_ID=MMETSP1423-20130617/16269_1 /TAXON_ID=476441 /ORGANISM="Pseudo-nitzschia heimii, Strain UNC1101" /LENGTH=275 /DNA_ID=CAMNT_0042639281 /DNA_START=230 /DNA_END=1057 /DNA_ORIENTATION=-
MGTGQQQIAASNEINGPRNGIPKTVTTASDEPRNPRERWNFKRDSGQQGQHSDDYQNPTRSFRNLNYKQGSFFLSKGSSDMKWQRKKMVVGALEVKSDPFLQPKEDMKPLYKIDVGDDGETKSKFEDALQAWEDLNLKKSFINACTDLPDFVCCCGLSQSDNASMIKQCVVLLNDGWVKHANSKIKTRGFKIDAFLWNWQNSSGKTSANILLLRFFELSTYKFRRASEEGSLDLDDMLLNDPNRRPANADDSSHYSASHNSFEDAPSNSLDNKKT